MAVGAFAFCVNSILFGWGAAASAAPRLRSISLPLPEESEKDARLLVGRRQRLDAELLANLQRLHRSGRLAEFRTAPFQTLAF